MSSCAICLEPELNSPAACVPCGHTFCLACITQWTRNPPRFGLSLCPQCRSPVREVQKLFISDWPVSGTGSGGGGQTTFTQLSAWQQFHQLLLLLVHFLFIPINSLAHYGPEMVRRLTEWANLQVERLMVLRDRLVHCAVLCQQEWRDLGLQAQCFLGAAVLLVALLLVQDLQDEDGIHRGIVLPILLLLVDIIHQTLFVGAFVVYRPLHCFLACGLEVGMTVVDVTYVVGASLLWVVWDAVCVPWLAVCVAARLLCFLLSTLAGVVRVCMLGLVLALSFGLPAFMAAAAPNNNQALRGQIPELIQAGVEWLRQLLIRHTQQDPNQEQQPQQGPNQEQQPQQGPNQEQQPLEGPNQQQPLEGPNQQQEANPRPRRRPNILREFLRLLSEELRNMGREGAEVRGRNPAVGETGEEGEGGEVALQEGEGGEVALQEGEGGGGVWRAGSSLEVGEGSEEVR